MVELKDESQKSSNATALPMCTKETKRESIQVCGSNFGCRHSSGSSGGHPYKECAHTMTTKDTKSQTAGKNILKRLPTLIIETT